MRASAWAWLLLPLALRALAGIYVIGGGFSAISDDDFARVVISQGFSHRPTWDPSESSWLPFPFWLTGSAMILGGTDIVVARTLAWVTSLISVLGVFVAARWMATPRSWSLAAACAFAILPHGVWLGFATVPEGYAAVLALLALASLCRRDPAVRCLGALLLTAATLSRYEMWPLVLVVGGFNVRDAFNRLRPEHLSVCAYLLIASVLSVVGPLAWLIHGHVTHGDALFFLTRVADYRTALAQGPQSWVHVLGNYPLALLTKEPETVGLVACALALSLAHGRSNRSLASPIVECSRLLWGLAAVMTFLIVGDCINGAPTHHPERPLLLCWLILLLVVARTLPALRVRGPRLAGVFVVSAMAGLLRTWHPPNAFVDRAPELALGRELSLRLSPQHRLFVETEGYHHLAVTAGTGMPWLVVGRSSQDPRQTEDPWRSALALQQFLERHSVGWLAVYEGRTEVAESVGTRQTQGAGLVVYGVSQGADVVENSDSPQ